MIKMTLIQSLSSATVERFQRAQRPHELALEQQRSQVEEAKA